jgi:hypothetical protein
VLLSLLIPQPSSGGLPYKRNFDLTAELAKITVPTLIIVGEREKMGFPQAEKMHELIKKSAIVNIQGKVCFGFRAQCLEFMPQTIEHLCLAIWAILVTKNVSYKYCALLLYFSRGDNKEKRK